MRVFTAGLRDTPILMADGSLREIAKLQAGDVIYGTVRRGRYRRYVKTQVLARWGVIKPAYRITLEDGTELTVGGDHRFLTERGWKYITGTECGRSRRPHLTVNNKLMGTGAFATPVYQDTDYRCGYLCGLIRGDGTIGTYTSCARGRQARRDESISLALCDLEALERAKTWLSYGYIETTQFAFASGTVRPMQAIRAASRDKVGRIRELIAWPDAPPRAWQAGFLAGIFDAEGSYSGGVLRISNTDAEIIRRLRDALKAFGFRFVVERTKTERVKPVDYVRIVGGLREHLRFFHTVDPAITRKRDISGQAVKSAARLQVVGIEPLGQSGTPDRHHDRYRRLHLERRREP